jgi:hypothetical protein
MSRATIILSSFAKRQEAASWCMGFPIGTVAEFREPVRSIEQNSRMWVMLTEISVQKRHYGEKLEPDEWKLLFLDALGRETRCVPGLEGAGLVNLRRSSKLTKQEMSDLMEIMAAWGANHGVIFGDESE